MKRVPGAVVLMLLLMAFDRGASLQAGQTAQKDDRAEVLLQAAMQKEIVEGDLEQAITLYKAIVATHGGNRPVAARALVQMARCYEKLRRLEARKLYEQVLREYQDQTDAAAEARARLAALGSARASTGASDLVVRRVSASVKLGGLDGLSRDGRYLTTTDWENSGNLVLIDIATGQQRSLTKKASWFESGEYALASAFSPGDREIAYVWLAKTFEIRLVGIDGSPPRVLHHDEEIEYISSLEWAPDGKTLAAVIQRKDGTNQIVGVSTTDGSARALKTLDWRYPLKMVFSPDGRYIAYDFPPKEDSPERDVFLLAADGSRETPLVQHPADDVLLGWAPEGQWLVFASDRSGTTDVWVIHVADGKPQGSPELLRPNMERSWPIRLTPSGSYYYGLAIATEDVYVATLDSTMSRVVTPPAQVAQKFIGGNRFPEWSPDGNQLAYVTQVRPGLPEIGSLTVTIQSLDTGKQRELFPPLSYFNRLRWSPDGRAILASGKDHKNRGGAYSIDAQTGEVTTLVRTGSPWWPRQSAWFRDGKAILYWLADSSGIRRRELEPGMERPIYRPGGDFALSPDDRSLVVSEEDSQTKASILKLVSLATGESRELARADGAGAFNYGCAWAPDGRRVLCVKHEATTANQLWRFSVDDGSAQQLLVMDNMSGIRVHPDGQRVAFTGGQFKAELWVMENFLPPLPGRGASGPRPK